MSNFKKEEAIAAVRLSTFDTGSTAVQIVNLTDRILSLAEHSKVFKKDFSARRGLNILVGQRRRLLAYLKKESLSLFSKVSSIIERP